MVMPRAKSASSLIMFQFLNAGERLSARTMIPISRERNAMEHPMGRRRNMIDGVKILFVIRIDSCVNESSS